MHIEPIFVDLPTAAEVLSVSPTTVQLLVREQKLKPPRKISGGRVGYLLRELRELREYAESCPTSDLLPPPNTGAKKPKKTLP